MDSSASFRSSFSSRQRTTSSSGNEWEESQQLWQMPQATCSYQSCVTAPVSKTDQRKCSHVFHGVFAEKSELSHCCKSAAASGAQPSSSPASCAHAWADAGGRGAAASGLHRAHAHHQVGTTLQSACHDCTLWKVHDRFAEHTRLLVQYESSFFYLLTRLSRSRPRAARRFAAASFRRWHARVTSLEGRAAEEGERLAGSRQPDYSQEGQFRDQPCARQHCNRAGIWLAQVTEGDDA
eukprot:6180015-Pleurochrysis_carterae.AAC.2